MATRGSLFVDTSGWAYLFDRNSDFHYGVQIVYQQAVAQNRLLVTTNYILAELVALLSSRSRIPHQKIIAFVDALKTTPHVEIIHIDTNLDASAWVLLRTYIDKEWSLVDASSFVIMNNYGMTEAITTDHHFTQAGFVRLPTQ
ncbi:MAG: type II toxin-antitoxin system VapC family toxin [Ktedonobacteraceae bacterium]